MVAAVAVLIFWHPGNPAPLPAGVRHAPPGQGITFTVRSLRRAQEYFGWQLKVPPWPSWIGNRATIQVVSTGLDNPSPAPNDVYLQFTVDNPGQLTVDEEAASLESVHQIVEAFVKDGTNPNGPYHAIVLDGHKVWIGGSQIQGLDLVTQSHGVVYEVHLSGPPNPSNDHLGESFLVNILRQSP